MSGAAVAGQPPAPNSTRAPAPRGARIEHRIAVQAPAEIVWELLCDIDGWQRWNPLYVEASGSIRVGETIDMTVALPGMKLQKARATVIALVPNEQLQYQGTAFGGLLRGTRYVEIDQSVPGSCIVSNGEAMGSLLGPVIARLLGERVRRGLQLMNEALKRVAEEAGQEPSAQTGSAGSDRRPRT